MPFDETYNPKQAALDILQLLSPGDTLYYGTSPLPTTSISPNPSVPTNAPIKTPTNQPTDKPTTSPTVPTKSPTQSPTDNNNNNNNNNIIIENYNSNGNWWGAFSVYDVTNGITITNFEIRDWYNYDGTGDNINTWQSGTLNYWGSVTPWVVQNTLGRGWVLPLDVRLTGSNGQVLTDIGVIADFNAWNTFEFTLNF